MDVYKCDICKRTSEELGNGAGVQTCCGQPMRMLDPGTSDGAQEKHVPVVAVDGNRVIVKVGEVEHPSTPEHYIEWIAIQSTNTTQRRELRPGDVPRAEFVLAEGEKLVAVYEYCNLHGLWKAEPKSDLPVM